MADFLFFYVLTGPMQKISQRSKPPLFTYQLRGPEIRNGRETARELLKYLHIQGNWDKIHAMANFFHHKGRFAAYTV